MGPIALFDKSFLQSLSVDESVWFDQFFIPVICPLFYVETLADLTKSDATARRSAEDEVRIIADKVPVLSGSPCANHRDMVISSLMGDSIPMTGQIPVAGGRPVRSSEGKKGVVFDESPESMAFTRWQHGEFMDVERSFAHGWRLMLTTLDLPTTADRMRKLGIGSKQCKTLKEAHAIATALVHGRDKPFDQMALLFTFVDIPRELTEPILRRWALAQYSPLAKYAPYAAHVLTVEIFFQIALAASLISADRPSNRVDIGYLFYLPFCMVFISGDKLHRNCAPLFLRSDQDFMWGPDLKAELARVNKEFSQLPASERERGVMKFAREPIGSDEHLLIRLWDKHLPRWRKRAENEIRLSPEAEKALVEQMSSYSDPPEGSSLDEVSESELDQLTVQRMIPKRKGSWWLLPHDFEPRDGNAK